MGSSNRIHDFIYGLNYEAVPDAVLHQARRCLVDLLGVLASGTTTPLSRIIGEHAYHFFQSPDNSTHLLGDGRKTGILGVVLAGAMTIDSIDAHDGMRLTKGHAGCGILPSLVALLATSANDYDDKEFLTGLVLGYEIAIRAGIALHASSPDYHTSGAWVALGVAGLGARVRGLTPEQIEHALGIAEYHGPRSQMMRNVDHPTMVKDGSGWGAMAGISAALLAEKGFTGAPALTVVDGALSPIWDDLGSTWHITDQYIKPWPVCRWAQPAIFCVLELMQNNKIDVKDIEKIKIYSFHEAVRLATRIPIDTEQAQYSLPWPVAAAAVRGKVDAQEITEPFDDTRIIELALGMELYEEESHNAVFPAERLARAVIVTKSGQEYASGDMRATWDPESPPSDDDILAKYQQLAVPVLGETQGGIICDLAFSMGEGDDEGKARDLIDALGQPFGQDFSSNSSARFQ